MAINEQPARPKGNDIRTSKYLSYILRHGAAERGLQMRPDGFVRVSDLLQLPESRSRSLTLPILQHIVDSNDKRRFELNTDPDSAELLIRAVQGHSLELSIDSEQALTRINDATQFPLVVHGTYRRFWLPIKTEGLKRMQRKHIHFATAYPTHGADGGAGASVVSGARSSAELFIEIDLRAALADGIPFYVAANGVVLTEGVDGVLPARYFARITDRDGRPVE